MHEEFPLPPMIFVTDKKNLTPHYRIPAFVDTSHILSSNCTVDSIESFMLYKIYENL